MTPLTVKEVFDENGGRRRRPPGAGPWGSPADCVKIGVSSTALVRPIWSISGINSGLNAGINVLYSGTVAAAIEGAFFGITSVAVSSSSTSMPASIKRRDWPGGSSSRSSEKSARPQLYNLNIPTAALSGTPENRRGADERHPLRRPFRETDRPLGREYYWLIGGPAANTPGHETDLSAVAKGKVTITPLDYNVTRQGRVPEMERWQFRLSEIASNTRAAVAATPTPPVRAQPRNTERGGPCT